MTAPANQAAALAALGSPITLADGTTVHLRYTMAGLMALEREFGDVARIISDVQGAANALGASFAIAQGTATDDDRELAASYSGPSVFSVVVRALAPGLLDAQGVDPRTGETVWLGEDVDVVSRVLAPSRLQEYMGAFGAAFNEAFGPADTETKAGGARPPARSSSRGGTGGGSRSGKPASSRARSGA